MNGLEQEYLKSILDYDQYTGIFTWKIQKANRCKIGAIAGTRNHPRGYIRMTINGKTYAAHRLAWLYMNGENPKYQIDHINRIRDDNRLSNLREATNKQNQENTSIRRDNKSGCTGVNWNMRESKWMVRIQHHGKRILVGDFKEVSEAIKARKDAEDIYYTFKVSI